MYRARITNLGPGAERFYRLKGHKVGDKIVFSDYWLPRLSKFVEVMIHYKRIIVSKKPCPECGSMIITTKNEVLEY